MAKIDIGNKICNRKLTQCGDGHPTFVIASVGTSQANDSLDQEIEKANRAARLGAHAITDHSFYGDISGYHRALVANVDSCISTVTNYEFAARCRETNQSLKTADSRLAIDIFAEQCARGIDLITVHASFLKEHLVSLSKSTRLIPTTSKGGGIISAYMRATGQENPYYIYFDELLAICRQYNVTISLGTTFRPATICDIWDDLLIAELSTMGELVSRAQAAGVPIMVEGIGHSTIANIPTHIRLAKAICRDAPYRILPMATDVALGFDHISAAIGAAVAVAHGANAITCISKAEHIGLPREEDLAEAIIATRIAAHCGEISLQSPDLSKDRQMSITRWQQGCKGDWTAAIYPEGAREALVRYNRLDDQLIQCSMCGAYCGIAAGISSVKHAS